MSDMQSKEFSKFVQVGPDKYAVLTNDISMASNKLAISAESVSFSAGAAGTTGVVGLDKAPVADSSGVKVGSYGNTSFSWVTGTILTAEVALDLINYQTDAEFLATLSNGQYAIDYVLGKIYYCKATTGTSDTCNYSTRQLNVEVTSAGVGEDVNIKQVGGDTILAANGARTTSSKVVPSQLIDAGGRVLNTPAEDSAHTTGEIGIMPLAVRNDLATALAGTDLDYIPLSTDEIGSLRSTLRSYDSASGGNKEVVLNPDSQQYLVETLVDTTNVATGTYYPSSSGMDMDGYKDMSFTGTLTDGAGETTTLTLEVSNVGGTTSTDWHTVYFYDNKNDTNVASFSATNTTTYFAGSADQCNFAYTRFLITTSAATNTVKLAIKRKAL